MFQKLDGYLAKIDNPDLSFAEKMKSFRNGMIRLKKVKKQINQVAKQMEKEMSKEENQEISLPDDFDWVEYGEELQKSFDESETIKDEDLETQLDRFLKTRGMIQTMEKYLETQHFEIKKICTDYEELQLDDITQRIVNIQKNNNKEQEKNQQISNALDQGVRETSNTSESENSTGSEFTEESDSSVSETV